MPAEAEKIWIDSALSLPSCFQPCFATAAATTMISSRVQSGFFTWSFTRLRSHSHRRDLPMRPRNPANDSFAQRLCFHLAHCLAGDSPKEGGVGVLHAVPFIWAVRKAHGVLCRSARRFRPRNQHETSSSRRPTRNHIGDQVVDVSGQYPVSSYLFADDPFPGTFEVRHRPT